MEDLGPLGLPGKLFCRNEWQTSNVGWPGRCTCHLSTICWLKDTMYGKPGCASQPGPLYHHLAVTGGALPAAGPNISLQVKEAELPKDHKVAVLPFCTRGGSLLTATPAPAPSPTHSCCELGPGLVKGGGNKVW